MSMIFQSVGTINLRSLWIEASWTLLIEFPLMWFSLRGWLIGRKRHHQIRSLASEKYALSYISQGIYQTHPALSSLNSTMMQVLSPSL